MAKECVTVKKEPLDLPEDNENLSKSEVPDNGGPEFVNIKTEKDEYDQNISVKKEWRDEQPSSSTNDLNETLLVEVSGSTRIGPECVEITIKVEPNNHYDWESEEASSSQVVTSSTQGPQENEDGCTCKICFKSFANSGNVQRHMLIHTKQKLSCPECSQQFVNKGQFNRHMSKHAADQAGLDPNRLFPCEHCDKRFKSTSNLMQHKKVHLSVKPYFCPQCHRSFAFKANLTKHQGRSRCKRPIDEPIQCHICHKTFEKEFLLKSHLRRHDTERPYSCDQCSMHFKYKSTLIRHIQLHNGVRPYACPVCDKKFTHSGLLKPHMRVHSGEKPYECPICRKCFAHKHNMQRHAIRHNKIKHLVCDVCHKKFPKESRLKYHMKIHVNEKHFSCYVCPKKFSHKQNVLRHYSRKHPNAKYECSDTDASVALKVWDTIKSKYSDNPEEILG